jgi:hypothetical protein
VWGNFFFFVFCIAIAFCRRDQVRQGFPSGDFELCLQCAVCKIISFPTSSAFSNLFVPSQVERITVTPNFDSIAVGFEDPLTQAELEDHLGEPTNIEWAHVMQMYFGSTDPRGQERQLGTLGGDLGALVCL